LLDEVAVELISPSDLSPWDLLHDGTVARLERRGDRVSMLVEVSYLRDRFEPSGDGFVLELLGCTQVDFALHEGPTSSFDEIAPYQVTILSADEAEDGGVVVWTGDGVLRLRYESLALRFDHGGALSLAALDECARAYWDAFGGAT
jgi:hypothetical protein